MNVIHKDGINTCRNRISIIRQLRLVVTKKKLISNNMNDVFGLFTRNLNIFYHLAIHLQSNLYPQLGQYQVQLNIMLFNSFNHNFTSNLVQFISLRFFFICFDCFVVVLFYGFIVNFFDTHLISYFHFLFENILRYD